MTVMNRYPIRDDLSSGIDTFTGADDLSQSMAERVAHDHPAVETIDATIDRHGGTTRPEVVVDRVLEADQQTLVRLVLDGTEYRAPIEPSGTGRTIFRHAARSPSAARNPGNVENVLIEWIVDRDLEIGRTVHLDVIESGFRYGLRAPGEEAIYDVGRPEESLAGIARSLDSIDSDSDN